MRPTPAPPLPAVFSTSFPVSRPCSSLDTLDKEITYSAFLKLHSSKFILSPLQPHVLFPYEIVHSDNQTTAFHSSSNGSNYQLNSLRNAESHELHFLMLILELGLMRVLLNVKFLLYETHYLNHLKLFTSVSFCTSTALYN